MIYDIEDAYSLVARADAALADIKAIVDNNLDIFGKDFMWELADLVEGGDLAPNVNEALNYIYDRTWGERPALEMCKKYRLLLEADKKLSRMDVVC